MSAESTPLTPSEAAFEPPAVVDVTGFAEARQAWKCPHLSAGLSGPGEELFHLGTVMRLDGREHVRRRRTMGELLKRRGHQAFRDRWLFPVAEQALAEELTTAPVDGHVTFDVARWSRRVSMQLAAALTGFDNGTTPQGADVLFELLETMLSGRPAAFDVALGTFDRDAPAVAAALRARARIVDEFYEPARERRRTFVGRPAEEQPQDLMMLMAEARDAAWAAPELAAREALFLLSASVHTTSNSLIWVLRELHLWLEDHPEDAALLEDDEFLLHAAQDAIRLHPVTKGFPRLATEDVELDAGTKVPAGTVAIIRSGPASLDQTIFGEDADVFNPHRTVAPGYQRFGLAFGAGSHMCYGMPIVMGTGGIDGSLLYLLRSIVSAGGQPLAEMLDFPTAARRGSYDPVGAQNYLMRFPAAA